MEMSITLFDYIMYAFLAGSVGTIIFFAFLGKRAKDAEEQRLDDAEQMKYFKDKQ